MEATAWLLINLGSAVGLKAPRLDEPRTDAGASHGLGVEDAALSDKSRTLIYSGHEERDRDRGFVTFGVEIAARTAA